MAVDVTTIATAAIAATPPTLCAVAILIAQIRNGRKLDVAATAAVDAATKAHASDEKLDRIDHAVNNQPVDKPPLVEHVHAIAANVLAIKGDVRDHTTRLAGIDTRLATVERKVG